MLLPLAQLLPLGSPKSKTRDLGPKVGRNSALYNEEKNDTKP